MISEDILYTITDILSDREDESFKKRLNEAILKMDNSQKELLLRSFNNICNRFED